jgi:hypothetical protein
MECNEWLSTIKKQNNIGKKEIKWRMLTSCITNICSKCLSKHKTTILHIIIMLIISTYCGVLSESRIKWIMACAHCYAKNNKTHIPAKNGIQKKRIWAIPRQRLDKKVTTNTQQYGKMCFHCASCRGVILKTTGATHAVSCWQFPNECQTLRTDQQCN